MLILRNPHDAITNSRGFPVTTDRCEYNCLQIDCFGEDDIMTEIVCFQYKGNMFLTGTFLILQKH